ncbi:MAG: hypothetical protein ACLR23_16740 [Clostridia bacterium]
MNYSAFKEDPDGKERVKALADGAKALIREAAASWYVDLARRRGEATHG